MAKVEVDCSELSAAVSDLVDATSQREDMKNYDDVVKHITKEFPELRRKDISEAILEKQRSDSSKRADATKSLFSKIKQEEALPEGRGREAIGRLEKLHQEGAFDNPTPKQKKQVNETLAIIRQETAKLKRESVLRKEVSGLKKGEMPKRSAAPERFIDDPKMKALKTERDALAKQIGEPAKIEVRVQELNKQIDALGRGELPSTKPIQPKNPRLEALEKQRDTLANNLRRINKLDGMITQYEMDNVPGKLHGPQKPTTPEVTAREEKLGALKRKADLAQKIDDLVTQLEMDHLQPIKVKKETVNDELLRLEIKRDKLAQAVRQRREDLKPKTIFQKVISPVNAAQALVRSLQTSLDLSAVLRQGGTLAMAHPMRAAKIFPDMLRSFGSEVAAKRVQNDIENRPNSLLYHKAGLELSDWAGGLGQREEMFASKLAGKIPGVKGSERAYTTFLNRIRADSFDAMTESMGRAPTKEEAGAIANFLNVSTGRGDVGKYADTLKNLGTVLYSPRNLVSRFLYLLGSPLLREQSGATRTMIAKEYARTAAGFGVAAGLALAAGATIETDPRSSDFMKFKFGNTRVDMGTGLQQITVLASRLLSGKTKKQSGEVVPIRGDKVKFGGQNTMDVMSQFARSKAAPLVGMGLDVVSGKQFSGQPVTPGSVAGNMIPLGIQDALGALEEQGIPRGSALAILAIMGAGVSTYQPHEKKHH